MESFWEGFLMGVGVVVAAFVIVWGTGDIPKHPGGLEFKKRPRPSGEKRWR